MYSQKLVTVIKHNGRVLRETDGTVNIPFGSEYTLSFKNLNSVRALVRVTVDGQDATKDTSLIVPANGTVELERFLEAGKMDKGHKFKFIERTKKIEDGPRGIGAEDGLIRVEFEFEKQQAAIKEEIIRRTYIEDAWRYPRYTLWNGMPCYDQLARGVTGGLGGVAYSANCLTANSASGDTVVAQAYNASAADLCAVNASYNPNSIREDFYFPSNDVGITVKGSESDQQFVMGAWFPTDGQKHVMVLKLLGFVGEQRVEKPVTVKTKQECPTCGTKNKHGTKFCRECGTSLVSL